MHGRPGRLLAVAALVAALVLAGCRLGPDKPGSGAATLTVTRDFGAARMLRAREDPIPGGETVLRFLSREAKLQTRYGGRFVNAIEDVRSSDGGGSRRDWLYYVNGIRADEGAADREVFEGDRIWWDYHDWSAAMRIPAVVGSFPEPFAHGAEGKLFPVRIDCAEGAADQCRDVAARMDAAGIATSTAALGAGAGKEILRLVVGVWSEARNDAAVAQLEDGPRESGVFARLASIPTGGYALELLDQGGRVTNTLHGGGGLVAATRFEEQQPTWVVTGTDEAGLDRAVALLTERTLRDRFAVATSGTPVALPVGSKDGPQ
jgi:uncharacterized protein DUF4430